MRIAKFSSIAGVMLCLLALAVPVQADTFVKQVDNTDAVEMMGQKQPARSDTSTAWYTEDKACMISARGNAVVYRADKGVMYMIDHNKKTYAEVPLTWLSDAVEEAKEDPETSQGMGAMGGMMKFEVKVTPTEETKKVRDWEATKYIVEVDMGVGKMTTNTWATSEVDIDGSAFTAMNSAQMAIFEDFGEGMEEMEKIEGVPVLSNTEMMMMGTSMTSNYEVIELEEKEAPEGIYEIPEGYEKTDLPNPMDR